MSLICVNSIHHNIILIKTLCISIITVLVILMFYIVLVDYIESKKENEPEPLRVLQNTHSFVHSAYYYRNSKSLGKNAIAIVTTMNKKTMNRILEMPINIVGTNATTRRVTTATLTTEHRLRDRCDYAMILVQTNTLDNLSKLEIESNGHMTQIPVREPLKIAPKPVVFCVSPQFAAEQWQTFLAQVHISKYYGAHLHIYVVSMIEPFFQLLNEYKKLGIISIEPWLTIKFPKVTAPVMEPNRNVELRAQTASHTDCILMYKEAAEFIGSVDLDDLLIPIGSHSSYYEEFERQYLRNQMINAINYVKYDYETVKSTSIMEMVKHAKRINGSIDSGKSFSRSEKYNSTWAHWSRVADFVPHYDEKGNKYFTHLEEMKTNGIFHFKRFNRTIVGKGEIPTNPANNKTALMSEEALMEIEKDLDRHLALPQIAKIIPLLPTEDFYAPIIFRCYNESFYHVRDLGKLNQDTMCINAYDCEIPQSEEWPCVHSDATYESGPPMKPITYHYAVKPFFTPKIGCFQ